MQLLHKQYNNAAVPHDLIFQALPLCLPDCQWRWKWSKTMLCVPSCKWWYFKFLCMKSAHHISQEVWLAKLLT